MPEPSTRGTIESIRSGPAGQEDQMGPRRPPEILRKSHAHTEGRARETDKRALRDALEDAVVDAHGGPALLIDLDGVIYRGDDVIDGAAAAVAWLEDQAVPYLFVTNTTSRPRSALVEKLRGFGIAVREDRILTPSVAAARWLAEHECSRLFLCVPEATAGEFANFENAGAARGHSGTRTGAAIDRVDAVVVGDLGADWTFDRLNRAFRYLMADSKPHLIALGMTRYWHASDGLRLDTAPFVVALAHASGTEPTVLGKPAAAFFETALASLGAAPERTLMIGDDVRADVGGAQAAGLHGILVRTGKFRPSDLDCGVTPDIVIDSISDLPDEWQRLLLHTRRDSR
jgi:phospholysine phosphohistidine inorganic pyrophosphate phosphatase